MIIKSLSRRKASYNQLSDYLFKERRKGKKQIAVMHNMKTNVIDPRLLAQEIEDNGKYSRKRKKAVLMFHEMLSFSPEDTALITSATIIALAEKYLDLRLGARGMGFATVHTEKDHIHIHFMLSANVIASSRKLRISRKEFESIKRQMSEFAKERFPELVHSYDHTKRCKNKVKERQRENQRNYRLKQEGRKVLSKKELARAAVIGAVGAAKTAAEFFAILNDGGFSPYKRGKHWGLSQGSFRVRLASLRVLELCKGFFQTIGQTVGHLRELEEIQTRNAEERKQEQDREFSHQ